MKSITNLGSSLRLFVMRSLFTLMLLLVAASGAIAESIYDYLPEDALGFVTLRNLNAVDAKTQKLTQLFEAPLPSPLMLLKMTTGLGDGLNNDGDAMLALLPGDSDTAMPEPMLLLPISDYEEFSTTVSGDASGEICRITISDEEVLVAKFGSYAILMNVENRETLEVLLGMNPTPVASLAPLNSWLADNDVVLTIMPQGAEMLVTMGKDAVAKQRDRLEERFSEPQFAEMLESMQMGFNVYDWILDFFDKEVKAVSWGLAIDKDENLKLGKRVLLKPSGQLAQADTVQARSKSVLAGFKDEPFVFAGGGPFPETWARAFARASVKLMQSMKEVYGFEDLPDEDWQKLEDSYNTMMTGLQAYTLIMLPGEKEEAMFSNFYGVIDAADSKTMLDSYFEASKEYNEVFSKATKFDMQYEIERTTVTEKPAFKFSMDMAGIMQDPNVPQFNWMLESMFGEEGKLNYLFVAANKTSVVYGMSDEEKLAPFIESVSKNENGLSRNAGVQTTMNLLAKEAPWKGLISPAGTVSWVDRLINETFSQLIGQMVPIPEFPSCPPIGISMNIIDTRIEGDMVWPAETLKSLAQYIKICQEL